MAVKLTINNPTKDADSVVVYRSETPLDLGSLPEPLATLPGTATDFTDATAKRNTAYYYRIAVQKGTDQAFTQNQLYGYYPDTGPGPQTLLRGNWKDGYFGTLTSAELFSSAELVAALGTSAQYISSSNSSPNWDKFILDGKILFFPQQYLGTATWNNLYNGGLVYGTDDFGAPPPTTSTANLKVNQLTKVTKGDYTFIVRLPKADKAPTSQLVSFTNVKGDGEYFSLGARMHFTAFNRCILSRRGRRSWSSLQWCATQHFASNTGIILFNDNNSPENPTAASTTGAAYWRPVLELML